jgi:hypothetical protein
MAVRHDLDSILLNTAGDDLQWVESFASNRFATPFGAPSPYLRYWGGHMDPFVVDTRS